MADRLYHVLFLSQRNSARSTLAEALLNSIGRGQFVAYSAGVRPAPRLEPIVLELLEHAHLPTRGLRPRHWREFSDPAAPPLDFVFTLSDTAAGEALPQWPGQPITAHWRSEDPARITDATERRLALIRVRSELERRLRVFVNLPLASLDRMSAQRHVDDIGSEEPRNEKSAKSEPGLDEEGRDRSAGPPARTSPPPDAAS
jgi:arsenate reductase (thioredoxin)